MAQHYKHITKQQQLELLSQLKANPEDFEEDEFLKPLADCFIERVAQQTFKAYELNDKPKPYAVYGKQFITANAIQQMDTAMQIPVAVNGAMMPDAHLGYGLPVGGVLATKNEVIPYAVGMDIGCRMALSILNLPLVALQKNGHQFKVALKEETHFGLGKTREQLATHEVLERSEFKETELLRLVHGKACAQIGTSGSGNHFVEFGVVELEKDNNLNIAAGSYLGILSHSGSRGLGATIANYFTKVAMDKCRLPKGAKHLAWLSLDEAAGAEYWMAMNLAGDYAKACHQIIHQKLVKAVGAKVLKTVENHHNFAWKEQQANGEEWIVHRKGATPAQQGTFGIIPGSMVAPGFIVSGKGNTASLNSASHGAGRQLSRSKMKSTYTVSDLKAQVKRAKITLIGGGIDEAPMAYKNIDKVMNNQKELVKVEGKFYPKIVRMSRPK